MSRTEYRRNSLRYPGYDYSQPGAVFVTVCTHNNQRLFGHVSNAIVMLSPAGTRVAETWAGLAEGFPDILIDDYIIMPDHLHGILMTGTNPSETQANTAGFIVRSFKNSVSTAWRNGVTTQGWPRYEGRLWHRDYHDRIIRNEKELYAFREYIAGNPAPWEAKRRQEG